MHIVRRVCVLTAFISAFSLLAATVTLEVLCGKQPGITMACEHMSNMKIWPHPNHTDAVALFRIFFDSLFHPSVRHWHPSPLSPPPECTHLYPAHGTCPELRLGVCFDNTSVHPVNRNYNKSQCTCSYRLARAHVRMSTPCVAIQLQ